jgi:hypothetical protein
VTIARTIVVALALTFRIADFGFRNLGLLDFGCAPLRWIDELS